jgi:hypothetical protein
MVSILDEYYISQGFDDDGNVIQRVGLIIVQGNIKNCLFINCKTM